MEGEHLSPFVIDSSKGAKNSKGGAKEKNSAKGEGKEKTEPRLHFNMRDNPSSFLFL